MGNSHNIRSKGVVITSQSIFCINSTNRYLVKALDLVEKDDIVTFLDA